VGAVVDFYGVGRAQPDYSKLQGPVLLVAPELDQGGGPGALGPQAEAIKAAGKQAEMVTYPGANHAFMNDTRSEVYKADAARDAWSRMVNHLKSSLK
jgi:carboxymethylenebutenolidase